MNSEWECCDWERTRRTVGAKQAIPQLLADTYKSRTILTPDPVPFLLLYFRQPPWPHIRPPPLSAPSSAPPTALNLGPVLETKKFSLDSFNLGHNGPRIIIIQVLNHVNFVNKLFDFITLCAYDGIDFKRKFWLYTVPSSVLYKDFCGNFGHMWHERKNILLKDELIA